MDSYHCLDGCHRSIYAHAFVYYLLHHLVVVGGGLVVVGGGLVVVGFCGFDGLSCAKTPQHKNQ